MTSELSQLLADLEEDKVLSVVRERLQGAEDPIVVLEECRAGMAEVGRRYEAGEYFLSDLVMSAEIFKEAVALVEPRIRGGLASQSIGAVVLGTAHGDIHDIGKNIVAAMLRCRGFDVHDLGVDVPPQQFVEKVKETGARVVGISVLLTTSFSTLKDTVQLLRGATGAKVLIGGGPVNDMVCTHVGADGWGKDAMGAVGLFERFS